MAEETKPAAEARRNYAVRRALRHDGRLYLPSEDGSVQVALTDAEAAELKALDAISDAPAASTAKPPKS
jgi:hypothetical protein